MFLLLRRRNLDRVAHFSLSIMFVCILPRYPIIIDCKKSWDIRKYSNTDLSAVFLLAKSYDIIVHSQQGQRLQEFYSHQEKVAGLRPRPSNP